MDILQTVFQDGISFSDLGLWSIVDHHCLPLTLRSLTNQVAQSIDVMSVAIFS